jgi:hypothetical protein
MPQQALSQSYRKREYWPGLNPDGIRLQRNLSPIIYAARAASKVFDMTIREAESTVATYHRVKEKRIPKCSTTAIVENRKYQLSEISSHNLDFQVSQPTVKGSTTFSRKQDDYVPEDLRQLRRKMGFDYGKFDFAIVDGTTILYDINRTPTVGRTTTDKFHQALLEELSYGFEEFLE